MLAAVSYYFPGTPGWDRVNAVDPEVLSWSIINPDSGPGYGSTWDAGGVMHQLYTAQMDELQSRGHTVLAYLTTNYHDSEGGTQRQFRFTATQATDTMTRIGAVAPGQPGEHGLRTGFGPVWVSNEGGALPSGLSANTDYWVISETIDSFRLANSEANARAGIHLPLSTNGTGEQWLGISRSVTNVQNVLDEIDLYLQRYPKLQGIFCDEMAGKGDLENVEYYERIFDYAVGKGLTVVQNPGIDFAEALINSAHTFMSYEGLLRNGNGPAYRRYTPPPWQADYPATKFWHCIKNVRSAADLAATYARRRALHPSPAYLWVDEADAEYTQPPSYLELLAELEQGH